MNSATSVWSTGSFKRWSQYYQCSSRYPFFCLPLVLCYFFFISVNRRLVSPLRFLVLVLSTMQLPQPSQSLLPPRLSTLLCHADLADSINACTLISVQPLNIFSRRIWILPRKHLWVVLADGSRFPFRNSAPIRRMSLKTQLLQQQ